MLLEQKISYLIIKEISLEFLYLLSPFSSIW